MLKKWHPDRWTKDPLRSGEAKRRFQQIQEAYSGTVLFGPFFFFFDEFQMCLIFLCCCCCLGLTLFFGNILLCVVLSDQRKRSLYDVGLYDTDEDEVLIDISIAVSMVT